MIGTTREAPILKIENTYQMLIADAILNEYSKCSIAFRGQSRKDISQFLL